jgi:hypothetical protein
VSRFLDEALDDLVRASRQALELAGHQLVDPLVEYPLPPSPGGLARPAILGDIQSRDSEGKENAFYVRTQYVEALIPEWLSSMIRESHEIAGMPDVYVVAADAVSETEVHDAETCGAGVLRVHTNRRLTEIVAVGPPTDEMTDQEFDSAINSLRGEVVSAGVLNEGRILNEFNNVEVVGPVSQDRHDQLMVEHADWREWRERRSHEVDQLKRSKSRRRLAQLNDEIHTDLANR